MAVKTAQEALENYQRAMSSGETAAAYRKGIQGTTVNPMERAATPDALDRYASSCARSVTSGHRARQLMGTSVATWKNNSATVGASRLPDGARKAGPKLLAQYQKLQSAWAQMNAIGQDKSRGWRDRVTSAIEVMIAAGKNAQGTL